MFDPARHTALAAPPWDEATARAAIQAIVDDAVGAYDPTSYWPGHALDGAEAGETGLYFGAAGMVWALDFLRREGAADHGFDVAAALPGLLDRNREAFAKIAAATKMEPERCSYLFGDAPLLLMMLDEVGRADALYARLESNADLPLMELMWGAAGWMLAAVHAEAATGEARWRELFRGLARRMLDELEDTDAGPMWTFQLYGQTRQYIGPVHGYAGNMLALIKGWEWLDAADHARIRAAAPATLAANAIRGEAGINWPALSLGREAPPPVLTQYCHGAPGIVAALAEPEIDTPELGALLEAGGELTWAAGPLAKGSNLCHGTGGNGFAFLKLHVLTGQARWLDRARAFAMAGIDQWRAASPEYGQGRYSLWTGDIGLALYLHECVRGSARFPTLDVI